MKNLHAYNQSFDLININDVDKSQKETYICCNCNEILIARKGNINAHHFAHKKLSCNYESYLHKVAKIKFFNKYSSCLQNKYPFYLEFLKRKTCTSCISSTNYDVSCELDEEKELFDLTKTFDKISIEKKHNGFIADILLESTKLDEVIFIEFAVTHKCEPEKIASKERIIEIELKEENDLYLFENRSLKLETKNISFYNFKKQHITADIYKSIDCRMLFSTFTIYKSGKAIKRLMPMYEILQMQSETNYTHFEVLKETNLAFSPVKSFMTLVQDASQNGIKIRNCFACRFSAKSNGFSKNNIFCKRLKREIENSNFGVKCNKFWEIEKENLRTTKAHT